MMTVSDDDDALLDATNTDSDGDGVGDNSDAFPDDPNEWSDDGDNGDNADVDSDGNGFADCIVGTTEVADGLCALPDSVQSDLTLTYFSTQDIQQPDYLLTSRVTVGQPGYIANQEELDTVLSNSATLTIEPGVHVRATPEGALMIARGSRLMAVGTRDLPITFSSEDAGEDGVGEWLGLEIGGFAPIYSGDPGQSEACYNSEPNTDHDHSDFNWCNESSTASDIGGDLLHDSSGRIEYVRILEAGAIVGSDGNSFGHYALFMGAVGYNAHCLVHVGGCLGSGVRLQGGAVNLTNLVITESYGPDIDVSHGYKGNLQYLITKKPDQSSVIATGRPLVL